MSTTVHSAAATGTDHWVQLLEPPRRPPATAVERHAMAALHDARRMRLDQFVDRLAHALYREELRRGGSAADIGLIGSALFRADARRMVEEARGALWTVDAAPLEFLRERGVLDPDGEAS